MLKYRFLPILLMVAPHVAAADLAPEQVRFFEQRIRPVLVEHCYACHSAQAGKVKGGLLLDSRAGWQKGGDSGEPSILPGKPDESLLIRVVRHTEAGLEMPPEKPRLPDKVIADLVAWVRMGAPDPRVGTLEVKRADKSWWSLQPLRSVEPPMPVDMPSAWSVNPIDRFVYATLAARGLKPNPLADPRTLIRRVTYDLTGLPPTAEEVETFVASFSPSLRPSVSQAPQNDGVKEGRRDGENVYSTLVDRLLASPHYGERWGRHWLDVVRFGESNGFERNFIIDEAWPFRDYVIRSFNDDKPFNQFIVEHLAGDAVGKDQPEIEVGAAFLTLGPYDDVGNQDPVAQANIRAATVDDMVTAVGSAFLGLTVNCARCHHHKFDPVPMEDYYRIKSAVDGVSHGRRPLVTRAAREQHRQSVEPLEDRKAKLVSDKAELEKSIAARAEAAPPPAWPRPAPSARLTDERFPAVEAQFVRLTILGHTDDPRTGGNSRIDEFEVWSAGDSSRNVALAANGGTVVGAAARMAKDFVGAYGVELVNDGKFGSAWIVGSPAVLTVKLSEVSTIDRVSFSYDRVSMSDQPIPGKGPAVAEYEIHVSRDGHRWQRVADSFDRQPSTKALENARRQRAATTDDERSRLADLTRQIAAVDAELQKVPPLPLVWAGEFKQPEKPTTLFRGGDPLKPGEVVQPGSLSVLAEVVKPYELPLDAPEQQRRLTLARWIVDDANPLTARVLANRVWHYHFGTGIVDTPSDFGFLGSKPTHPELLDWLARRLQAHGWRLKALHREIVMSQVYRQSSAYRDDGGRLDKDARLLWRFPPQRLDAEEIRDTLLAVAGKLDGRLGGPGFRLYEVKADNVSTYTPLDVHGPETYRRAVYHQSARASVVDLLSDFDLPDNAFAAPKRARTTTPLQALTLLNHRFTLDMATALAERIERESSGDAVARVTALYRRVLQRPPSGVEQAAAVKLVAAHGLPALCRALLNSNELIYLD